MNSSATGFILVILAIAVVAAIYYFAVALPKKRKKQKETAIQDASPYITWAVNGDLKKTEELCPETGDYACAWCCPGGAKDDWRARENGFAWLHQNGAKTFHLYRFQKGQRFPACPECDGFAYYLLITYPWKFDYPDDYPPSSQLEAEYRVQWKRYMGTRIAPIPLAESESLINQPPPVNTLPSNSPSTPNTYLVSPSSGSRQTASVPEIPANTSGTCDVCGKSMLVAQGYYLNTTQVVTSEEYWKWVFTNIDYLRSDYSGSYAGDYAKMMAGQSSAWCVCSSCISMFPVDRETASYNARHGIKDIPGNGPADLNAALLAAAHAWKARNGRYPSSINVQ